MGLRPIKNFFKKVLTLYTARWHAAFSQLQIRWGIEDKFSKIIFLRDKKIYFVAPH